MTCPNCQKEISLESKFCRFCGHKIAPEFEEETKSKADENQRKDKFSERLFNGRLNRRNLLIGYILLFVSIFVIVILDAIWQGLVNKPGPYEMSSAAWVIWYIIFILYGWSLAIRRLHDLGKSGWYLLVNFVPLVNIIWPFYIFLGAGEKESNKYGPRPEPKINLNKIFGLK